MNYTNKHIKNNIGIVVWHGNECDRIWENLHSSHIQFCSFAAFGDPYNPHGLVYRYQTFRDDRGISVLLTLKLSYTYVFQIDTMSHQI